MTFLELVNLLRAECSVSGSAVPAVTGQIGEFGRLVRWIQQAYEDVQNQNFDWNFLKKNSTFTTVASINVIPAPSDLNIWDIERIYDADRNQMEVIQYADLDYMIDETITGKPQFFVLKNDNTLMAYPKPDDAYLYYYNYYRKPFELLADNDTPAFPSQFHRIIVARAMIYYGNYESAPEIKTQGSEIFQTLMRRLIANQTPYQQHTYGRANPIDIRVVPE